jgi:hypothetical protein
MTFRRVVDHAKLVKRSPAYEQISLFYGERKAERSRVRLMQHINDGLVVLDEIGASLHAREAFCLHPMFQADADLKATVLREGPFWYYHAHLLLLVMEYRNQANAWLSDKVDKDLVETGKPTPGPLSEVRDMLIADKVQNRKDFETYHKSTHPRSAELDLYFYRWLLALDVEQEDYDRLCEAIDRANSK